MEKNWEIKEFLMANKKYLLPFLKLAQENENKILQNWIKEKLNNEKMEIEQISKDAIFPSQINNFIKRNNKFEYIKGGKLLFYGPPGTGKTFAANRFALSLNMPIRTVKYSDIISKRMGDTMKNLEIIFMSAENEVLFLDEVDVILTDRIGNDIDEMKRVTGNFLWLLDNFPKNKVLILATNIKEKIDEAIIRRIDYTFNFNQYEKDDLINIYRNELNNKEFYEYSKKDKYISDSFFSKKILNLINNSNDITPYKIKKAIDKTEFFYKNHNDNNYYYLFEELMNLGPETKNGIVCKLKESGFSINEIFSILKNEYSISNENIRKIVKGAKDEI